MDYLGFFNEKSYESSIDHTAPDTYNGVDGYTPMAAYLGQEGYGLKLELRAGSQHCQNGTPQFLQRVLERARQVTAAPSCCVWIVAMMPSRTSRWLKPTTSKTHRSPRLTM